MEKMTWTHSLWYRWKLAWNYQNFQCISMMTYWLGALTACSFLAWVSTAEAELKVWSHKAHGQTFPSPSWECISTKWRVRLLCTLKLRPQRPHMNGFSPVWVRKWTVIHCTQDGEKYETLCQMALQVYIKLYKCTYSITYWHWMTMSSRERLRTLPYQAYEPSCGGFYHSSSTSIGFSLLLPSFLLFFHRKLKWKYGSKFETCKIKRNGTWDTSWSVPHWVFLLSVWQMLFTALFCSEHSFSTWSCEQNKFLQDFPSDHLHKELRLTNLHSSRILRQVTHAL